MESSRTYFEVLGRASKVKSLTLASKPEVLENCPVLRSRTALFFEWLKFCRSPEKTFEDLFFLENTCVGVLRPWLRAFLSLASRRVCLLKSCPWPRIFFCVLDLGLKPCVLVSTSDRMPQACKHCVVNKANL